THFPTNSGPDFDRTNHLTFLALMIEGKRKGSYVTEIFTIPQLDVSATSTITTVQSDVATSFFTKIAHSDLSTSSTTTIRLK
ncbi:12869_t:CDS:2, partial [Cetraspora pellucida]